MATKNGKNEGIGIVSIVIIVIFAALLLYYFFSLRTHKEGQGVGQVDIPVEVPAHIQGT